MTDNRPICPDCNEVMVKALMQDADGDNDWVYRWLCGCKAIVKTAFCPRCEKMQSCRVMSSTSGVEELDCLWCGEEFEIDKFIYSREKMNKFMELTG